MPKKEKAGEKNSENPSFFKRHEFLLSFLFFLIFFSVLALISLDLFSPRLLTCGDGSFYDSCSFVKPYYCDNGSLVEKASLCGCSESDKIQGESCMNQLQTGPKEVNLSYTLFGVEKTVNFTVYKGMEDYLSKLPQSISYDNGQAPSRENFSMRDINQEQQQELLLPLVIEIENMTNDKTDQARIAVSLVQNIAYGASNRTVRLFGLSVNYSRYPYDVLYDSQGLCGEKSELLAFLLKGIGYDTVLFYFPTENHEAVGIKCPMQYSYDKTGYCFVETTGPAIISDSSMQYVGGITLQSQPEIINVSSGISLRDDLREYQDARTLANIREGKFVLFAGSKFESLKREYGLTEYYYIK